MIVTVYAPTALAIRMGDAAGVTLIGIARDNGVELFSHPALVLGAQTSDAA